MTERKKSCEEEFAPDNQKKLAGLCTYLNNYEKKEIHSPNLSANIYSNDLNKHIKFDVIFKDNEVYIKTTSDSKVHLIDSSSEVRLLEQSEKEFIKAKEEEVSDFTITDFKEDTLSKKQSFIPLSKGILNGFKTQKYLKTRKFTFFALIASSIILAFLVTSLSSIISIKRTDYRSLPTDTVLVELKTKEISVSDIRLDITWKDTKIIAPSQG